VSRHDQGAATGKTPYGLTRCKCGHLSSLHAPSESGKRHVCSAWVCTCRRFTEATSGDE
jgi:hypothetical protein